MQATRQRILEYLEGNPTASAVALSQFLEMTSANLRHHLSVLVEQGFVEVVGEDTPKGKGRPTLRYMAVKDKEADGLEMLLQAWIGEIREMRTARQRENRLRALGKRLARIKEAGKGSVTIRLSKAMQKMNELGYKAHWEAHAEGPQAILGRCPYAGIIDAYPELCQMDALMLGEMLGEDVALKERFARKPEGPHGCVFRVG